MNGLCGLLAVAVGVQENPSALRRIACKGPGEENLTEIICLDGAVCNGNRICRNGNPGVLAHTRRRDLYGVGGVRIHALYGGGAAGDGGGFIKAAGVVASDGPAGYRRLRLIPG